MMLLIRRGLSRPSGELLFVCSVLFVVITVVHYDHIQQNWSRYHWEDPLFFEHNRQTIHTLGDCLTQPALWPGLYRPLTTNCYYYVGGWLFAHRIEIYHAINVLLYTLNALLFYWFVRPLVARPYTLLAAVLFASRAAHVEVVTNTVEFQVLAATFFSLLALLFFATALRQRRSWLLLLTYPLLGLALLSKEASIAVVFMLPLYAWLFVRPWQWSYLVGPLAVGAGWFILFATALHRVNHDQATGFHFTFTPALVIHNMTAYLWSFANSFAADAVDFVMPPWVQTMANTAVGQALLLAFIGVTLVLLLLKPWTPSVVHVFTLGGAFFLLAILPYSFFEDRLFMRYGYFSHTGLAVAAAALVLLALDRIKVLWTKIAVQKWFAPHPEASG
jgi:4-amino-4-deoxy-L-arabinose transferase-like glycosyltransferase